MAYTANIPAATDALSQSQGQIQANFLALAPCVGGLFANQGGTPGTTATQIALTNINDGGGSPQLWIQMPNNAVIFPITASNNTLNYTLLPSGFCIKFGAGAVPAGAGTFVDLTYDASYPFTRTPIVMLTPQLNGGIPPANWYPILIRTTGFVNDLIQLRVYRGPTIDTTQVPFTYMAIGPIF